MNNLDEATLRKKLETIIAMADSLKDMATGLKRKLEYVHTPAPKRGNALSAEQKSRILSRRKKHLNKSISKT
jgi:hypothetical protein